MRSFFLKYLNLLSLAFLAMGALLLMVTSVGAQESAEPSECSAYDATRKCLTDELLKEAGETSVDFSNVFSGTSNKPEFKNLYLLVYQKIQQTPNDQALKKVADQYQYTEEEMRGILSGSLGILFLSQDQTVSNDDAFQLLDEIQKDYAKAYDDARQKQEMLLDTYPKEIFSDGNTGNSGFDLMYDLDIIELLLFGDESATVPAAPLSIDFDSEETEQEDGTTDGTDESGETPETVTEGVEETGETKPDSENSPNPESTENPPASTTESSEPIDPAVCTTDPEIQKAFESAATTTTSGSGSSTSTSSGSTTPPGTTISTESAGEQTVIEPSSETITIEPAIASDWVNPPPCNSVFCLVVRFVNDEGPSLSESANCIQCHTERILEALKETVSKGLVPGKLPGNLMEPAVCKRSLLNVKLNLNFISVAVPIRTPSQDDLIIKLNMCDSLTSFVEESNAAFYGKITNAMCEGGKKEITETEKTELKKYYQRSLTEAIKKENSISDEQRSSLSIYEAALGTYEAELKATEAAFRNSYTRAQMTSSTTDFYRAVGDEMDQMISYFTSFKSTIGLTQKLAAEMEKNLQPVE